ncbi:MAG: hypothetical protein RL648_1649 [Verrucomicrobiota bacterium]|jgi:predicted alpha-1,2-mannosidase
MKRSFSPLVRFVTLFISLGVTLSSVLSGARAVDLVEPLVDSANSRWFFFNSASRPFGMVNLSPDMVTEGAWNSGYRYKEDRIRAFSHIHGWQLSGIPVFPTIGEFKGHLGSDTYGSRYSHDRETVEVGYHQVYLEDGDISVELTSTTRVGFHRYTFPESDACQILFDFATYLGPGDTGPARVQVVSSRELEGVVEMIPTLRRPTPVRVHFVAQLDRDAEAVMGWRAGRLIGEVQAIEGEDIGVYFQFASNANPVCQMKVAISYVSVEQARRNLAAELPHWSFESVVEDSKREWDELLSRIEVEGGTLDQRRRFYTDLWHALLGRRIVSDVDGQYSDWTSGVQRVRQVPLNTGGQPAFAMYNSDSFWGAQWTIQTLWQLVYPEIAEAFVNSLVQMYKDGGLIPRGPSGGNYTYVMTGASSTPFIVAAYMKGLRNFDVEAAYEGLKKNHSIEGMMARAGYEHTTAVGGGMRFYVEKGYVPYPNPDGHLTEAFHKDGSGQTLEYAYQDWALSQFAMALGREEDAALYGSRALNYRNLWNAELGWMWNREVDGSWHEPLDILRYHNGWVESNAVQATWYVPHDTAGLARLMGGRAAASDKLNESFEVAKYHGFVSSKSHDKEKTALNRRVTINYGNQPSMQTAMLFNHFASPWLTQYWSREVVEEVYSGVSPYYGYSGDEDQGLMGALAVLMKIGLFSMRGGAAVDPVYEITSPLFDRVRIALHPQYYPGGVFHIECEDNIEGHRYIQSATLNGTPLEQPWFFHRELVGGGVLQLTLTNQPNRDWGAAPHQAPPSLTD